MNPFEISVRSNVKEITKSLSALAYKQLPFATATALTMLAKEVQAAEKANIQSTFKHPKPFTVNAMGMKGATKATLEARVFVRPIAAKYLEPYETGGMHVLPGRSLLNPKDIKLNQYGQLSRGTLQRLKARADIFIGPLKTKHGEINGVWQRVKASRGNPAHVRLLLRFGDALEVNKRLEYGQRAKALVASRFDSVFGTAMAKAMASAR
jgi:hypothetical protein